jgi:hypothetical protein
MRPGFPKNLNNKLLFELQSHLPRKALWCKNNENRSDEKSHTWAPLRKGAQRGEPLFASAFQRAATEDPSGDPSLPETTTMAGSPNCGGWVEDTMTGV